MWRIKYTWRYTLGHNDRTFCKIFMMGIITTVVVLSLLGCKGPVEVVPLSHLWHPQTEDVCLVCDVDSELGKNYD